MSTEDYEALLTPEREHKNGSDDTAAAAPVTVEVESTTLEMPSIEDDIQEARALLVQAAEQRKADLAKIASLENVNASFHSRMDADAGRIQKLGTEVDALRTKVAQFETENKRLQEGIKREISRGLLRQDMDNLRKVL